MFYASRLCSPFHFPWLKVAINIIFQMSVIIILRVFSLKSIYEWGDWIRKQNANKTKSHFMDINSDTYCSRQNTKILLTENNKANYDFPEDVCEVDSSPHHRSFRIKRTSRGPWFLPCFWQTQLEFGLDILEKWFGLGLLVCSKSAPLQLSSWSHDHSSSWSALSQPPLSCPPDHLST